MFTKNDFSILRFDPIKVLVYFTASFAMSVLGLAMPLVFLQIYDRIIPNHSTVTMYWLFLGCLIAFILEFVCRVARSSISYKLADSYKNYLSLKLFSSTLQPKGSLEVNYLQDLGTMDQIKQYVSRQIDGKLKVISELPFSSIYWAAIYMLSKDISYALLMVVGGLFFLASLQRYALHFFSSSLAKLENSMMSHLIETFQLMHVVKSLAIEAGRLSSFYKYSDRFFEREKTVLFLKNFPSISNSTVQQGVLFGVILISAMLLQENSMTIGKLTACMILSSRFIGPFLGVAGYWIASADTKSVKDKLLTECSRGLHVENKGLLKNSNENDSIVLSKLILQFPNGACNERNPIDCELHPGNMHGISISHSQGGSKLLKLIAGLEKPMSGEVYYKGRAIDSSMLADNISFVSKDDKLFKGTVLENLTCFDKSLKDKALQVVDTLNLNPIIADLPDGFRSELSRESNYILNRNTIQYLILARALIKGPKVLLLDNIEQSFDQEDTKKLIKLLKKRYRSLTILINARENALLEACDYLYKLDQNGLVELGKEKLIPTSLQSRFRDWVHE